MSITTSRRARWAAASVTTLALGVAPFTAVGGAAAAPGDTPSAGSASSDVATASKTAKARKGWKPLRLQILGLNDFHGQLERIDPLASSSGRIATGPDSSATNNSVPAGGAEYLGTHLEQLRAEADASGAHSVTVAAGDLIGATPLLSAAFHDEPSIEAMNEVGLDIASVGNHEFDEGWRELLRMQRGGCLADGDGADNQNSCPDPGHDFDGADFDYLAANVKREKNGKTILPSHEIKRYDGIKVAFIGMTLQDTPNIVTKAGVAGLRFTDEVRTVEKLMPRLKRQRVKSIVVLLHEGAVPDPNWEYDACPGISGPGLEIAMRLPRQVDAVVSGHTHQAYNCKIKPNKGPRRLLTSASSIGRMVTEINLEINRRSGDVIRKTATAENHIVTNTDGTAPMKAITDLIALYNELVAPIANQVLGKIAPIDAKDSLDRPSPVVEDYPLGNLIAESQLAFDEAVGPDGEEPVIAFMNPGGIRASLVEDDDLNVTYGAAFAVQPFNNYVTSQTLTGAQILDVLNEQWNGRNQARNNILQVAGISYTYDRSLAADPADLDAVVEDSVMVDLDGNGSTETPLDPAAEYRIVVNSFLSDGGDGFSTFAAGEDKFFGGLDIDALADYLATTPAYEPGPTDRITVVD